MAEDDEQLYKELIDKIKTIRPMIFPWWKRHSWRWKRKEQKEKIRLEPYIIHPLKVGIRLWRSWSWIWRPSRQDLLNDIIEDTPIPMRILHTCSARKCCIGGWCDNELGKLFPIPQRKRRRQKTTARCSLPWQRIFVLF